MKIGVSAFAWTSQFDSSYLHILPAIREGGLSAVEIPLLSTENLQVSGIRRALKASDLECSVCVILPSGINPISPDVLTRRAALAHLVRCVEISAELGARLVGGPLYAPIGYLPGRRRTENEWNWAVECFQKLGDVLDTHRMNLSIEPVNRAETFFLRTAAEATEFTNTVDHPRIGITIDTFHANIEEKNIVDAVYRTGSRLSHVHASENDRGLLGSGHIPFPEIMTALRQIGYEGYVMIEGFGYSPIKADSLGALWGDPAVSPEDIAFLGAQYLRKLLAV